MGALQLVISTGGCGGPGHSGGSVIDASQALSPTAAAFNPALEVAEEQLPTLAHRSTTLAYVMHDVIRPLPGEKLDVGYLELEVRGKEAKLVADVLRVGASHDMLDPRYVIQEYGREPAARAFLLVVFQDYRGTYGTLAAVAREELTTSRDEQVLVASMQVLARQGDSDDLKAIAHYSASDSEALRDAAARAKMFLMRHSREGLRPRN